MNKVTWKLFTRFSIGLLITALTISTIPNEANANPVEEQRKKAAEIAKKIEQNGDRISVLAETYNETRIRLDNIKRSVNEAKSQLEVAEQQNREIKKRVQQRVFDLYTSASSTEADGKEKVDLIRKEKYADIASGNDNSVLLELEITRESVLERKAELDSQLAKVEAEEKELAEKKKEIEAANAEQQRLLDQTRGELARLVEQERERRQTQSSPAPVNSQNSNSGPSNVQLPGNLPAPSPKAAIAIEFARQQLGKPYKYATSGPNTYDCSGLTKSAWGAAGVSMPHFSGAQYAMFPKVPLNALQPGDLVYRPGHIGLYIGGGLMIHAPQTGDVVKISATGRLTGASRPG